MTRILIGSLTDPRLDPYRNLTSTNLTRWSGLFVAEGKRVVERLVASDFETVSVLVSERHEKEASFVPDDVPLLVLPQRLAEDLVGYNFHAGFLACGRRRGGIDPLALVPDDGTLRTLIACPNVDDPENLGALIRIGAAFGVDGLLLGRGCADPFSRRVLRVSMGTAFSLPIVECDDLAADLDRLRSQRGVRLAATVLDPAAVPLERAQRPHRLAILFGNEAHGLSPEWIDRSDLRVMLPMHGGTDSLNVAVAAGIFLYHFTRVAGTGLQE